MEITRECWNKTEAVAIPNTSFNTILGAMLYMLQLKLNSGKNNFNLV